MIYGKQRKLGTNCLFCYFSAPRSVLFTARPRQLFPLFLCPVGVGRIAVTEHCLKEAVICFHRRHEATIGTMVTKYVALNFLVRYELQPTSVAMVAVEMFS